MGEMELLSSGSTRPLRLTMVASSGMMSLPEASRWSVEV